MLEHIASYINYSITAFVYQNNGKYIGKTRFDNILSLVNPIDELIVGTDKCEIKYFVGKDILNYYIKVKSYNFSFTKEKWCKITFIEQNEKIYLNPYIDVESWCKIDGGKVTWG